MGIRHKVNRGRSAYEQQARRFDAVLPAGAERPEQRRVEGELGLALGREQLIRAEQPQHGRPTTARKPHQRIQRAGIYLQLVVTLDRLVFERSEQRTASRIGELDQLGSLSPNGASEDCPEALRRTYVENRNSAHDRADEVAGLGAAAHIDRCHQPVFGQIA